MSDSKPAYNIGPISGSLSHLTQFIDENIPNRRGLEPFKLSFDSG